VSWNTLSSIFMMLAVNTVLYSPKPKKTRTPAKSGFANSRTGMSAKSKGKTRRLELVRRYICTTFYIFLKSMCQSGSDDDEPERITITVPPLKSLMSSAGDKVWFQIYSRFLLLMYLIFL
jgi:hypothetical protein